MNEIQQENMCHCGELRHKHDISIITELEADKDELQERNRKLEAMVEAANEHVLWNDEDTHQELKVVLADLENLTTPAK